MDNLIEVKQLPIIEENLRALATSIDEKVSRATSLVCSVETYKDIKAVRSELNNEFKVLEEQRKAVKKAVLDPYNRFEAVYKECVSNKYKDADADLKEKINVVETFLKTEKAEKVKQVFESAKAAAGLDWLSFDTAGIKINLSDSDKKLTDLAIEHIEKVKSAVEVVSMQEYPEEILIEYKKTLNLQAAIKDVLDRKAQLAAMQSKKDEDNQPEEEQEAPSIPVESISFDDILNRVIDDIAPSFKRVVIENVTDEEIEKLTVLLNDMNLKWRVE